MPAQGISAELALWETALDAAAVGAFELDLATGVMHSDKRMQTLWGLSPEDGAAMHVDDAFDRIHAEDRAALRTTLADVIEVCGSYREEFRIIRPDGTSLWICGTGKAIAGPDGHTVRILGAAQDITGLRTAKDEAARLVSTMRTGFISYDRDWRISNINAPGAAMAGLAADDLIGRVLWEMFPGLDGLEFGSQYRRAMDTGQIIDVEAYYPATDAWFEVRSVPTPNGLSQYFSDITERHRDHEAVLAAVENLRLLAQVGAALAKTDIDAAIGSLATALVPALADWALVTIQDQHGRFHDLGRAHGNPAMSPTLEEFATHIMQAVTDDAAMSIVTRTGQHLLLTDYPRTMLDESLLTVRNLARLLQPDKILTVPVSGRQSIFGAISLVRTPGQPTWTPEQTETALEIGRRAGVALENARLLQAQHRMSETLQNSLLSAPHQSDDLEIAVRYQAAAQDAAVGGDWYDSFPNRDGSTTLVVGDVTGHNQHAAAAMGQLKALLRGTAYAISRPPATVLTALDEAIHGLNVGTLATCILAQVEKIPTDRHGGVRRLRWSNAGHPPPLLLLPGHDPVVMRTTADLLLGLDPTTSRHDHSVALPDGATLLLYTDGLIERRGEDIDDSLQRLALTLTDLAALPLPDLIDTLLQRLAPNAEDDVVILAARCHPQTPPLGSGQAVFT